MGFNSARNCFRLMVEQCRCCGSEFQTAGAAIHRLLEHTSLLEEVDNVEQLFHVYVQLPDI